MRKVLSGAPACTKDQSAINEPPSRQCTSACVVPEGNDGLTIIVGEVVLIVVTIVNTSAPFALNRLLATSLTLLCHCNGRAPGPVWSSRLLAYKPGSWKMWGSKSHPLRPLSPPDILWGEVVPYTPGLNMSQSRSVWERCRTRSRPSYLFENRQCGFVTEQWVMELSCWNLRGSLVGT
jgi:hypothetical protein